ncbi:MAG: hypothetical protein WBQ23_10210 [Bacteroidota bacterium]
MQFDFRLAGHDVLIGKPQARQLRFTKTSFAVDAGIGKRQTAAAYLQTLEDAGVLASETIGRKRIFINPVLLELSASGKP